MEPTRQPSVSGPSPLVTLLVLGAIGLVITLSAVTASSASRLDEDTSSAEQVEDELVDGGLPRSIAQCFARRLVPASGDEPEDSDEALTAFFTCSGVPPTIVECMVAESNSILGGSFGPDEFARVVTNLDRKAHEEIFVASIVCTGLPRIAAECIRDGMLAEYGDDAIETMQFELPPAQQTFLRSLSMDCVAETVEETVDDTVDPADQPDPPEDEEATPADGESGMPDCPALGLAKDRLDEMESADRVEVSEDLYGVADLITAAAAGLDETERLDLDDAAYFVAGIAETFAPVEGLAADDGEAAALATELLERTPEYVSAIVVAADGVLPGLFSQCDLAGPGPSEAYLAINQFAFALEALSASGAVDGEEFFLLQDLVAGFTEAGEVPTGPISDYPDAYEQCLDADFTAAEFGDDEGCDVLYEACGDGDERACDDLYWASIPGTAYELFAATCGERVRWIEGGYGYCSEEDMS